VITRAASCLILGIGLCLTAPLEALGLEAQGSEADRVLNRGQEVSTAVSRVTSTAISPLLGVCLIGIYAYVRTPDPERGKLPLFAKPKFWIPISILLILIFLKDSIGAAVPLFKKPLDALEVLLLNKASLFLIVLPVMFNQAANLLGLPSGWNLVSVIEPVAYAADSSPWQTASQIGLTVLTILAGFFITLVVWLVGHTVDVLVLLSPFPFLDLFLKGCRTALMLTILLTALVDRRAGLVLSLLVIAVSILLFSWALRLTILGTLFAFDLLALLVFDWHSTIAPGQRILGFTAGKVRGLPRQAFGSLTRDANGILEFRYRRLGFGPERLIRLDDAVAYEIGRGVFYPSVILPDSRGSGYKLQFRLLPRYKGVEEDVRAALGISAVRDLFLSKGLRSFWRWVEGNGEASGMAGRPV